MVVELTVSDLPLDQLERFGLLINEEAMFNGLKLRKLCYQPHHDFDIMGWPIHAAIVSLEETSKDLIQDIIERIGEIFPYCDVRMRVRTSTIPPS